MRDRIDVVTSSGWRRLPGLAHQLLLVAGAVLLYFGVRGRTEGSRDLAIDNANDLLGLERAIGLDIEAAAQALILPHDWALMAVNWIYIWGHWPVIAATLVWLYRTRPLDYLLLRNALFLSGAIGLVIFVTYPVAPPRLLPSGYVDTVTELSTSYRVLQPPSLVNKYAALPSLHVGWNLLIGLAVYRTNANRLAKVFCVVSPVAMVAAVVLTGNHYVIDAILGAVVALTGLALALWLTPKLAMGTRARRSTRIHQSDPRHAESLPVGLRHPVDHRHPVAGQEVPDLRSPAWRVPATRRAATGTPPASRRTRPAFGPTTTTSSSGSR